MADNTIGGWLAKLPEPYKTQAFNNVVAQNRVNLDKRVSTLAYAISSGFMWYKAEQGIEYWTDVQTRAARGDFD